MANSSGANSGNGLVEYPEGAGFPGVVARTTDEFCRMLELAVGEGLRESDRVEQFVRANSWETRVKTMGAFIAEELDGGMEQVTPSG